MSEPAKAASALDAAAIAHQRIADLGAMFRGIMDATDDTTARALARAGVNLSEEWSNEFDVLAEECEAQQRRDVE